MLRRRLSSSAAKWEEGEAGVLVVAVGLARGAWLVGLMLLLVDGRGG